MQLDLLKSETFEFWLPFDMAKAGEIVKARARQKIEDQTRWIEGIGSTDHRDLQNEDVVQSGIEFAYFLEYGYYNNDHKPGFENKVGEPTEAKITREGLWTKGFLYKNHKVADAIWELAHALEASNATRKLGFSIQGKVMRRAGNRILKCWVQDVAITAAPINTHTWLDIVKSIEAVPDNMWCESEYGVIYPAQIDAPIPCASGCGNACAAKSMNASLSAEVETDLQKKEEPGTGKAAMAGGSVLVPESLGPLASQTYGKGKDECKCGGKCKCGGNGKCKKSVSDTSLGFDDCVTLLEKTRGLSTVDAHTLTKAIFEMNVLTN